MVLESPGISCSRLVLLCPYCVLWVLLWSFSRGVLPASGQLGERRLRHLCDGLTGMEATSSFRPPLASRERKQQEVPVWHGKRKPPEVMEFYK